MFSLVLHGYISQFLAWFCWYMVQGGALPRVCVPICIAVRYEKWGNGRKRGDEGGITAQLRNKSKILLVILPLLPTLLFDTTNTFCIRCSTRSFDRVVRYVLGKAPRALFSPQYGGINIAYSNVCHF